MKSSEAENLKRCKKAIEDKLNWGSSVLWLNYDFERLNELIFAETKIQLSITTLKRVFGKASYHSSPSLTTLNTLAQFAGFVDWRDFVQHQMASDASVEPPKVDSSSNQFPDILPNRRYFVYGILSTLFIISLIGFVVRNKEKKPDYLKYSFRADKVVTQGLPNSVVFTYDATAAKPQDSVFIVQTWDISRRKLIDRTGHHHSAIYYYPGYFRAKLLVNKEIVRDHVLQIKTDNWLALVESATGSMPIYFTKKEVIKGKELIIDRDLLCKYNLPLQPSAPAIRLFNQGDIGDFRSDNFTFETVLRNDFSEGSAACQRVQVLIQCKDDVIIIPLCAPACVGNIGLVACGSHIESTDADLSGFGCNLNDWTKLRVEARNKRMTFFVNSKQAYALTFPNETTDIVGLQYRFGGTGAVKDTWIEGASGRYDFEMK